ncbi:Doublesex- And Mab-3-Related Transcription Factor 1, partial [Manis pentadactyla]
MARLSCIFTVRQTDIEADGVGSGYSVRDISITERVRFLVWRDGECKMLNRAMADEVTVRFGSVYDVSDGQIELLLRYGMTDIEADGVEARETMRLWIQDCSEARVMPWLTLNAKAEVSDTDAIEVRAGIS